MSVLGFRKFNNFASEATPMNETTLENGGTKRVVMYSMQELFDALMTLQRHGYDLTENHVLHDLPVGTLIGLARMQEALNPCLLSPPRQ